MLTNDKDHEDSSFRRTFIKAAAAGALGSLAGCTGDGGGEEPTEAAEDGGSSDGGGGGSSYGGGDTETDATSDESTEGGGGGETVTIDFLSATLVENTTTNELFKESMARFEEQKGNVNVKLSGASFGDIKQKLSSSVQAGNPPTIAQSGSLGLDFYSQGRVPSHKPWLDETEDLPDAWHAVNKESANYRGEWWSGGAAAHTVWGLAIRPKLVSQVGVSNPEEEFKTWSGMFDIIQQIDEELDTIAWEETGTPFDLESYWSEARTAHTGGDNPWIRGEYDDPEVIINNGQDSGARTDGMIKNLIQLADEFSSEESPNRPDEDMPSIMLTDRNAIYPHGTQSWTSITAIKEDATFGWQDGEGDFMLLPIPELDSGYGSEVGISELEGFEGEHGGHVSGLEASHTIFDIGDQKKMDLAWDLNYFMQTDDDHLVDIFGRGDAAIPTYQPKVDIVSSTLDVPQPYNMATEMMAEYGPQYMSTGATWDVGGTDQIRWTDINETISEAMAGQHDVETLPQLIRERVLTTLENQN